MLMRRQSSNQRPYWKKILFFAALFLFLVGTVIGISRASALAASDADSGSEVKTAQPVASSRSGVTGKNPKTSDAQVKIMSNDNGKPGEEGGQSNDNQGKGEAGTTQPMVNVGNYNAKFPQTSEAPDPYHFQIIGGVGLVVLAAIGYTVSIKRRTES
ncbi:MAG: hypothetical protein LKJ06_09245 [Schleiferilactobacillus harbinensis]|jgi:hypothetical protein|nr:hypothetical protein [Schleiferilactobacillus harbinensis]